MSSCTSKSSYWIFPDSASKRRARIEIVPLIDIVFFLLATFVMVSLSMVKHKGIPVVLPSASTGLPQEQKDHVVISISDTGQLYLDKKEIPAKELYTKIRVLHEANPDLRVLINGDVNARLGLAIEVLDEVRKSGITKVAFETAPKPSR
jgi:biopolymer transport protein ExbD